ncbi:MAG: asparagine synthase C-terminal domain-containing protein, partial [Actinomycetota bacterium]|nr:asparagine synthase C-terminal domain-containing protein [Actinomycetota bacterium]
SSLVVALMARVSSQPPRTFTIGFEETSYDESPFAKRIAQHLGTDHTELIVSESDALAIVPQLGRMYSEPFADSSQIPTRLVSELARQSVTVALSGDGGDELFGGYDRYRLWPRLANVQRVVPHVARYALATGGEAVTSRLMSGKRSDRVRKLLRTLGAPNDSGYRTLMSDNPRASKLVVGSHDVSSYSHPALTARGAQQAMLLDTLTYLPDDLLTKVDRASMSVSLEVRVPLLDPEVFRFAWGLPDSTRIRDGQGKWILRQVLSRHVPTELFERPKMGFGVPLGCWLSGPLHTWASQLLEPSALRSQGYLQPEAVTALWNEHSSGRTDRSAQLWPILMFQSWLNEWAR